jgi:glycosyltransferase involved in cell wall biosynthesis
MHIGIDARFLGAASYGLAQYSESLLLALSRHDTKNRYTVFVNAGLKRRPRLGENFHIVPIRGRPLSLPGIVRFSLALRHEKPDILHVHFPLVPLGVDCPTLITVHDIVPFRRGESGARPSLWDRLGMFFIYPFTMRRARWILCVSNATRNKLVDIFPEVFHKTIVRASGVEDLYQTRTEDSTAGLVRTHLEMPQNFILYSGSIGEDKNLPRMIEAFAELRSRDPRAKDYHFVLDITGDARGLSQLKSTIRRLNVGDAVRVLTSLSPEERRVLFESARLLFILSREEGFGAPVLKAQMLGVPVLAAEAGALPEICGKGALLVPPDERDAVAQALDCVLFDDQRRATLIDEGRKNARRFSWDDTAKQVKQIYELLF